MHANVSEVFVVERREREAIFYYRELYSWESREKQIPSIRRPCTGWRHGWREMIN